MIDDNAKVIETREQATWSWLGKTLRAQMYACYLYGLTLPPDCTAISRTRLSFVRRLEWDEKCDAPEKGISPSGQKESNNSAEGRLDKPERLPSPSFPILERLRCCARGRPIIVEWERDARHSAGLSLVR
ncbi:hypothetical protein EVAR_33381_1 [Eumeta japonica]|uniref:Uncharacterized protein n=1 Tax=Eumeta variegata TaxID=151549 RepID=A0A4C1X049_EUMVA|nr:hypothetical protein EVAR_33381_1 [Eumeta japonica]